ncbi:MAG TPA: phosphotransferase [Gaiellaceae bacterium]|nr:phosphotransferase [Gaiellaceae bacterium]
MTRGSVVDVEWSTIGEEYGFASCTGRVALRFDAADDDAPSSLVAKLPTHGVREVRFYREVPGAPRPALYYADADDAELRAILLLEDLTQARQGDVLAGCSVEDARRVLGAVAPFHARHWHAEAAPPWLRGDTRDPLARQARFDELLPRFLELQDATLPADVRDLVERLRSRLADVIARLDGSATTLIHWDLQLDNVLFDAGLDRRVAVLDWETVRVGNPAWDVASFLYGSLDVGARREAEEKLLDEYVALLVEHGVRRYDGGRLLRDCRLALLVLLAANVGWLAQAPPGRDRERALRDAVFSDGRLVAALLDHDVGSLLEP